MLLTGRHNIKAVADHLRVVGDNVELVRDDIKVLADDTKFEKRRRILEWLSPSFSTRHEELQKTRADNSGNWFLASEKFTCWIEGTGPSCLLCIGIRISPSDISLIAQPGRANRFSCTYVPFIIC